MNVNVNVLYPATKRQDWLIVSQNKAHIYAIYKRPSSDQGAHIDWNLVAGNNIFHVNGNEEKTGVAILYHINRLNKVCYKRHRRTLLNDQGINPRKRYNKYKYIITNITTLQHIRWIITTIKGEFDSHTIIMGYLNSPVSPLARLFKPKINKETQALNNRLDRMALINSYRTFYPKTVDQLSQVYTDKSPE